MATIPTIATIDDLKVVTFQGQRLKIGTNPTDNLSEEDATIYILRAESKFYGYVKRFYIVPFIAPKDGSTQEAKQEWELIKTIVVNLAAVDIYLFIYSGGVGDPSKAVEEIKQEAMDLIKAICSSDPDTRIILSMQELISEDGFAGDVITSSAVAPFGADPFPLEIQFPVTAGYSNYVYLDYYCIVENSEELSDVTGVAIYKRGTDYEINYKLGAIWRLVDGTIPSETIVHLKGQYYISPTFYRNMQELQGDKYGDIIRVDGYRDIKNIH